MFPYRNPLKLIRLPEIHSPVIITILRCMDSPPYLSAIFEKGDNFYDFQFSCRDRVALPVWGLVLTLLHSERPKLHTILAFLSAVGLKGRICSGQQIFSFKSLHPSEKN